MFRELNGDLFYGTSKKPEEALLHCVSRDFYMGRGIAVEFGYRFGGAEQLYAQNKTVGQAAVIRYEQRWIYYLVTKEHYYVKSTYDIIEQALKDANQHMEENNVTSVSMPQIGSGLDKLQWIHVRDLILRHLANRRNVTVYKQ